jgi:hypothetical protein
MLAGGHCIPVRLPQAARLVWHKLYSSTNRHGFPEKAAKDLRQALVLAAVLAQTDPEALTLAYREAPAAMANKVRPLQAKLAKELNSHAAVQEILCECLKA